METWYKVFVLSIGGALGVNSRFWLGMWMSRWTSPQFPWATVFINVSGSFAGEEGSKPMKIEGDARRVTVYIGTADTWGGRNLAVAIVEKCRKLGMAGATVTRGVMGFGKHSIIHRAHLLGLSDDLPEKIEIVDRPEQIDRLLPALDQMMGGGLVVVEDVHVARYAHGPYPA